MVLKEILKSRLFIVSVIFMLFIAINITPSYADDMIDHGTCGKGLTWSLYYTGQLVISGKGEIESYSTSEEAPWSDYRPSIKSLVIEDGVTEVGRNSFGNLYNMESAIIPNGIKKIGESAFYNTGLKRMLLPEGIEELGNEAFGLCNNLEVINLPDSLQTIGEKVITNTRITSLGVPNCESIGDYAFEGNDYLRNAGIADGVDVIPKGMFSGCRSLTEVNIPSTVTKIEGVAFSGCELSDTVLIPDSVSYIGWAAFNGCLGVRDIYFDGNAPYIGESAFGGTPYEPNEDDVLIKMHYKCNSTGWDRVLDYDYDIGYCDFIKDHEYFKLDGSFIEPTCIEDGKEADKKCSRCGELHIGDTIQALGHKEALIEGVEATCIDTGITEGKRCLTCGAVLKEQKVIPALGHTWNEEYTVDKTATCTEEGSESIHCSVCGEVKEGSERAIEKTPHKYGEWNTTKEPNCTEKGSKEKVCSDCGEKVTEDVDAFGHIWNKEYTVEKDATCTEDGVESIHCSECDAVKEGSARAIEKTTHNYGEWNVTTEPTCTDKGSKEKTCIDCGDKVTEDVDAIGHHWGAWTVTKQATTEAEGVETRVCKNDPSHKETRPIPKLKLAPGADPKQMGTDGTAVGTGASAVAAEKALLAQTSDVDPKGAVFGKLRLKSTKQTKKSITISWTKVSGAAKYVIYGNRCGKNIKKVKLGVVSGNSKTFSNVAGKKVKKGTYYKFIVVALDKNDRVVSTSMLIHAATKGGKVGNPKSVKVKKAVVKKAAKLKKGKTLKLNAKQVAASKKLKIRKHVNVRYESSNAKIATVTKKGVVKGKSKGTCYIYAYAQNGVAKKIKVKVR